MKKMTKTLAISGAIAAGIMMAAAGDVYAGGDKMEKCYGVAKAGKNDCAGSGSSCAGSSKIDGQKDAWMYVPKGACEKIVGGSKTSSK